MAFSPCSECARHVRVEDEACPFCGSVATRPAPKIPRRSATRVTRAALFFAGVLGASACDSGTAEPVYGGPPTSQGDEDDPGMADIYGGPPVENEPAEDEPADDEADDEAEEATDDAPEADEAMPVEAYGAPAPPPDGE